jgi:hypothetical protein
MRFFVFLSACLILLANAGCQQSAAPVLTVPTQGTVTKIDSPGPVTAEPAGDLIEETWDAYSMQGVRVGYAHTTSHKVIENSQSLIRTKSEIHLNFQRLGNPITQDMTLASWDTPDGKLVRFESRMTTGDADSVTVGAVRGHELHIETTTLGRTHSQKIPWRADWGGFFAPEQSLRRKPLHEPGEKRTIHSFSPLANNAADTKFEALDYETIDLPGGKQKLLRLSGLLELGNKKIESVAWMNERGELLKTYMAGPQHEAIRTTKEIALERADQKLDLLVASTVSLKGTFVNPHTSKQAVYRARVKSGQIAGLFSDGLSQRVKLIDDQTAEITVVAIRPGQPPKVDAGNAVPSPTNGDLASSNFLQIDDTVIQQMASHIVPDQRDPWKVACALEKFVGTTVENKNFSTAFATAAEVARSLEGDCTEHAVLLAALCRARKIPAHAAFGLVYFPPQKGFAYHMWNEVWIQDRWIPLDATLMLGGIGADHIKLGDSNLSGGSPLTDLLGVVQVFGRLELELLSAE